MVTLRSIESTRPFWPRATARDLSSASFRVPCGHFRSGAGGFFLPSVRGRGERVMVRALVATQFIEQALTYPLDRVALAVYQAEGDRLPLSPGLRLRSSRSRCVSIVCRISRRAAPQAIRSLVDSARASSCSSLRYTRSIRSSSVSPVTHSRRASALTIARATCGLWRVSVEAEGPKRAATRLSASPSTIALSIAARSECEQTKHLTVFFAVVLALCYDWI